MRSHTLFSIAASLVASAGLAHAQEWIKETIWVEEVVMPIAMCPTPFSYPPFCSVTDMAAAKHRSCDTLGSLSSPAPAAVACTAVAAWHCRELCLTNHYNSDRLSKCESFSFDTATSRCELYRRTLHNQGMVASSTATTSLSSARCYASVQQNYGSPDMFWVYSGVGRTMDPATAKQVIELTDVADGDFCSAIKACSAAADTNNLQTIDVHFLDHTNRWMCALYKGRVDADAFNTENKHVAYGYGYTGGRNN